MLPLSGVDQKLRAVSQGSGKRCAYPAPAMRRAQNEGWLTTDVMHVFGTPNSPEQLWVSVAGSGPRAPDITFKSLWKREPSRMDRYRAAFASLVRQPDSASADLLLGALAGRASRKNHVTVGGLTLCESKLFGACTPETKALSDVAPQLTRCFSGADDDARELLFEGKARCELAGVDDPSGPDGKLEACLCNALGGSAGVRGRSDRRLLDVHYEAPDIQGKPRPELRVVEASHNIFADSDWRSLRHEDHDKTTYTSVRRLVVDNLDGLQAPLARCALAPGSVVVADLSLSDAGSVDSAVLRAGTATKKQTSCIQKALSHGAFNCSTDGKPASLRIAISWP